MKNWKSPDAKKNNSNKVAPSEVVDLVDDHPVSKKKAPPLRTANGSSRKRRVVNLDDDEDDDEEEYKPAKHEHDVVALDDDPIDAPEIIEDLDDKPKPKSKRKTPAKAKASAKKKVTGAESAPVQAAAFGGSDQPEGGVAPAPKKQWKPRSDTPPNYGTKDRPKGSDTCFKGMQFVITGILDSLLREQCVEMIKEHGGKVVGSPSKKCTHAVVGEDPGESKMKKINSLKLEQINEDGLFKIMRESCPQDDDEDEQDEDEGDTNDTMVVDDKEEDKVMEIKEEIKAEDKPLVANEGSTANGKSNRDKFVHLKAENPQLWVDKYAPKEAGDLVGNPKHRKDLALWLQTWKDKFLRGNGHKMKLKDRKDSDHAAVLLAGPPGIGKTSAAHAVCKQEGFEPLEFNASDVRNKGGIIALADSVLVTSSITKYLFLDSSKKKASPYPNGQVLIMDEVDGMSGGDRGGSAELIKLIKTTKIPIICIANDDTSPKMRSMANNCFKMKFRRPTAKQVTKRISEIIRKEGFKFVDEQTIDKLAVGCHGDIRQMINLLQTWRLQSTNLKFSDVRERLNNEGKTVMSRSIFELALSFFKGGPKGSENSLENRTENYFSDADLIPLFVQENYVITNAAVNSLEALADAAESISEGDMCSNLIRGQQRWDLMPTGAILQAIIPGSTTYGGLTDRPNFPTFFGTLSKTNKFKRIVQELEMKVKAGGTKDGGNTTSGSIRAFRLDYIPTLTTCLATPLIMAGAGGIEEVIDRLDAYYLEKDPDWLDILEMGVYGKGRSPMDVIDGKVKAALTRSYKAGNHARTTVTGIRFGVAARRANAGADITKIRKNAGESGAVDPDPDSGDEDNDAADKKDDDLSEFAVKKKAKGGKKRAAGGAAKGSAKKRKVTKRG